MDVEGVDPRDLPPECTGEKGGLQSPVETRDYRTLYTTHEDRPRRQRRLHRDTNPDRPFPGSLQ